MAERIKILFGTFPYPSWTPKERQEYLTILERHDVKYLDTASSYPDSEKALGESGAPLRFLIDTKAPAFFPKSLKKETILSGARKTLEDLKVDSVETYYLHAPDKDTPIEETLEAIQELYTAGKFKKFGLSNYQPEDVQKIYDLCSSKGYVLPTVYQGNYNPVARISEKLLFPTLRKLSISFNAYSPLAGGFLVKTAESIRNATEGRWDPNSGIGAMYHRLYNRPTLMQALDEWDKISMESGVSKGALAYRWVAWNSFLSAKHDDGIILGATRPEQLEETLNSLDAGPLDEKTVKRIDEIWELVKDEAPLDNING